MVYKKHIIKNSRGTKKARKKLEKSTITYRKKYGKLFICVFIKKAVLVLVLSTIGMVL